ncbi:hypothetical protein DV737_g1619, partial [Chaetothyriales sp. CBS 132003]
MSPTVVRNTLVFDGESVHQDATVIFEPGSGLITSVSTSPVNPASYPAGATVIDGQGHTLLPGLIDAHIHCYDLHAPEGSDPFNVLKFPLRAGVTTVCDMHSDPESVHALQQGAKADVEQARKLGPAGRVTFSDLKSSHLGATIQDGWPKPVVLYHNPREEVRARVARWPNVTTSNAAAFIAEHKAAGADYIKLMQENCCSLALPTGSIPSATLEVQTAVVDAAHGAGLNCYGHATSIESTELVLKAGGDGLTHTFVDQPPTAAIIELYKEKGAFVIPTLVVLASLTNAEGQLRQKFADLALGKRLIDDWSKDTGLAAMDMSAPTAKLQHAYDSVIQLKRAGIDVVAGTDSAIGLQGTMVGPSLWMELHLYVDKCGFSPLEALRSATSVSARRFGFHDRGLVKEGKRADLVLVSGDVTKDLAKLWEGEGITRVWKSGIPAAGPPSETSSM